VTAEKVLLRIHHGEDKWGRVTIPRKRVATIEYDLSKRLEDLEEDDYAGRYKLGEWAYRNGMSADAVKILNEVAGKPDVPPEAFLYLGKLAEEADGTKEALEFYGKYLLAKPGDEATRKKIAELQKLLAGAEAAPAAPAAAPAAARVEGLEGGSWRYERWGNKADVSVVTDAQGNKLLQVVSDGTGNSSKVAVTTRKNLDLSEKSKVAFTVYNKSGRPVQLALALITSSGYYESRPIVAKDGWSENLTKNLKGNEYKCQATNWKFNSTIKDLNKTQAIIILLYNGKRKGVFFFDEVTFK